eukprot:m51a1_g13354 hypothetical protein (205) ;mRNA; r:1062-1984
MAACFAVMLARESLAPEVLSVYTFGQRRVGDAELVQSASAMYSGRFYRFVHADDAVARFPAVPSAPGPASILVPSSNAANYADGPGPCYLVTDAHEVLGPLQGTPPITWERVVKRSVIAPMALMAGTRNGLWFFLAQIVLPFWFFANCSVHYLRCLEVASNQHRGRSPSGKEEREAVSHKKQPSVPDAKQTKKPSAPSKKKKMP